MSNFSSTPRTTLLASGQVGGPMIGGNGQLSSTSFSGQIGLGRFIKGNLTGPEIDFLNTELSGWLS